MTAKSGHKTLAVEHEKTRERKKKKKKKPRARFGLATSVLTYSIRTIHDKTYMNIERFMGGTWVGRER